MTATFNMADSPGLRKREVEDVVHGLQVAVEGPDHQLEVGPARPAGDCPKQEHRRDRGVLGHRLAALAANQGSSVVADYEERVHGVTRAAASSSFPFFRIRAGSPCASSRTARRNSRPWSGIAGLASAPCI